MSAKLFEPYTIRNVTLKNRIVMSPMCMYACPGEDGMVQDFHLVHYTSRAIGQVGLIIQEATAVLPEGRISPNDLGIWDDRHIEGLAKLVANIKENGAHAGIQLAHAGRKATVREEIFAPSAIPFSDKYKMPTELDKAGIERVVSAFKEGALRAKKAGFDVIEIHAAHGYLLNEFLSSLTNRREDEYGGSAENRYRILREVIDAVRSIWDGPLFVRISACDYAEGGMTPEDYVPMVRWMKEQGVDFIDVSSGGVVPDAKIKSYPGYQVPYSEIIRREVSIPTGAVGLITSPLQAEEILQNGRADLVFLGRELLRNPYWPYQAAVELKTEIPVPVPYKRGWTF